MRKGSTPFGVCEVRCWRWLFGNKIPVSRGVHTVAYHTSAHTLPPLTVAWRSLLGSLAPHDPGAARGGAVCFTEEVMSLRNLANSIAGAILQRHQRRITGELEEAGGVESIAAAGPNPQTSNPRTRPHNTNTNYQTANAKAGGDEEGFSRALDRIHHQVGTLSTKVTSSSLLLSSLELSDTKVYEP